MSNASTKLAERLRAAQLRGNTAPAELDLLEEAAAWIDRIRQDILTLADSWGDGSGTSVAYTKLKCARQLREVLNRRNDDA